MISLRRFIWAPMNIARNPVTAPPPMRLST